MNRKKKALAKGHNLNNGFNGKYSNLSGNDLRVLHLLLSGKYTVIQITNILKIPDPRSNIRYLRKAGFKVSDNWINTQYSHCKEYFIKQIGGIE